MLREREREKFEKFLTIYLKKKTTSTTNKREKKEKQKQQKIMNNYRKCKNEEE